MKSLRINGFKYLMYVELKIVVLQMYRSISVKKVFTIYYFLVNISFIQKERFLDAYNVEGSHLRIKRCYCNYRSANWVLAGDHHITNFRPDRVGLGDGPPYVRFDQNFFALTTG